MASLVDSVMGLLGPVAGSLANQMGESTDTVQRGLQEEQLRCSPAWPREQTNRAF